MASASPSTTSLRRELSLLGGIVLAIGSIFGSGVLFLPSLTYSLAGTSVLLVWFVATLLCVPLLFILTEMVRAVPTERGVEGFVSLGLGKNIGAAVPLLILGTSGIGLPCSAIVAGEYVQNFFSEHVGVKVIASILIVYSSIGTNLLGLRVGTIVLSVMTFLLLLVASALFFLTAEDAWPLYRTLSPNVHLMPLLSGITVAFWAYVGFENLTFIAGEFKRPERDFKRAMVVALVVCGVIYFLLSGNYAALIPYNEVKPMAGLYQLSEKVSSTNIFTLTIMLFAFLAVLLNFNAWVWGVSRLMYSSAKRQQLPTYLAALNSRAVPHRAVITLGVLFGFPLAFLFTFPDCVKSAIVMASSNYVVLYILCLTSFLKYKRSGSLWWWSLIVIVGLLLTLASSGWMLLYPLAILLVGSFLYRAKHPSVS